MDTPLRYRIFSQMSKTRFLHIEDALEEHERPQLRLFIGSYERGDGANATAFTFLDLDDARVVMSDLAWGKAIDFTDHKGGKDANGALISRVLKIQGKDYQTWIQISNGMGLAAYGGIVKPNGKPFAEISMPLERWDTRRLGFACLAYLAAWDAVRMGGGKRVESRD